MRAFLLFGIQMKFSLEVTSANIIFLQDLGCVFHQGASLFHLTCAASWKTLDGFNFFFFFNLQVLQPFKHVFSVYSGTLKNDFGQGQTFCGTNSTQSLLFCAYLHWHLICYRVLEHFPIRLLEPEFFKHETGLWINLRQGSPWGQRNLTSKTLLLASPLRGRPLFLPLT